MSDDNGDGRRGTRGIGQGPVGQQRSEINLRFIYYLLAVIFICLRDDIV